MLLELKVFILFNNFNSGVFDRFTNKHLQNRFNFVFIIKQISISVKNLSLFYFTFRIWNQNGIWRSINIIVRLNVVLIDHVLMITQFLPQISTLHLLSLHIKLIAFLQLLLSEFFLLSSPSHFFLSLTHICFLHLLFFYQSWIWLHINRNYKCCESITSNNTSIIHKILRGHLTI